MKVGSKGGRYINRVSRQGGGVCKEEKRENNMGVVAMLRDVTGRVKIGLSNLGRNRSKGIR